MARLLHPTGGVVLRVVAAYKPNYYTKTARSNAGRFLLRTLVRIVARPTE